MRFNYIYHYHFLRGAWRLLPAYLATLLAMAVLVMRIVNRPGERLYIIVAVGFSIITVTYHIFRGITCVAVDEEALYYLSITGKLYRAVPIALKKTYGGIEIIGRVWEDGVQQSEQLLFIPRDFEKWGDFTTRVQQLADNNMPN